MEKRYRLFAFKRTYNSIQGMPIHEGFDSAEEAENKAMAMIDEGIAVHGSTYHIVVHDSEMGKTLTWIGSKKELEETFRVVGAIHPSVGG